MKLLLIALVLCVLSVLSDVTSAFRGTKRQRKLRSRHKRNFPKYKHHPVSPEEDFFGDEVYPKRDLGDETRHRNDDAFDAFDAQFYHNPLNLTIHDWEKFPDGVPEEQAFKSERSLTDTSCDTTFCQTMSCSMALRAYTCDQLERLYCPGVCSAVAADCAECAPATTPEPSFTCEWRGTLGDTSCGAQTEAECYLTAREHEAQGTAETMKLTLDRTYIDDTCLSSDTDNPSSAYPHPRLDSESEPHMVATCCFTGQIVDPCFFDYGRSSYQCDYECTQDDILTTTKKDFINGRLDWVEGYFATLFKSRPLVQQIDLSPLSTKESTRRIDTGAIPSDTHLLIIVTAQPSGIQQGIAGYAIPLQSQVATNATRDHLGGTQAEGMGSPAQRVVVGHFNWCPDTIDEDEVESNFQQGSSNRLVVHELLHLMNAVKTSPSYHASEWGGRRCPEEIYFDSEDVWSGIYTRKVVTPTALALGREQFGCDDMAGLPIENQVIGYGSHWETRCFGPEVLAYGENMGEAYISDITLGFIEDMGFYIANYSAAGRFGDATHIDIIAVDESSILYSDSTGADDIEVHTLEATEYSPGFLRWGRLEGCSFCFGNPKNWPEEYLCRDTATAGCTPDRRMSARCSLNDWGAYTTNPVAPDPILYQPSSSGSSWEPVSPDELGEIRATNLGILPEVFNYLEDDDYTDGITAGYSDANEFVPVMVGYWNCLDEQPPSDASTLFAAPEAFAADTNVSALDPDELAADAEEASDTEDKINFGDLFDAASSELGQVKGQSYGLQARCFESTLVPLADVYNLDLTFTENGLCYVANCYSKEYLQVGIRGATGEELLYWYGCPPEGGVMYIPGFSGAITCPAAEEFCFTENISGELYSEIDLTLEWILWGTAAGVILLAVLLLCCFWKKIDHKIHFCCGINQDQKHWQEIMEKRHGKHSCAAYILTTFSILWLLPGLALLSFAVYTLLPDTQLLWDTQSRQVPIMFALSGIMILLSCMGIDGSFKPNPSIVLILYFYITLILSLASIFACAMPFVLLNVIEQIAAMQWEGLKHNFPDSWQGYNSSTALGEIQNIMVDNLAIVISGVAFIIVSEVQGVICSFLNLTTHVVIRNFEMVMNCVFLAIGIVCIIVSAPTHSLLSQQIFLTSLITAILLILTGIMGVFAACQRHEQWFIAYGAVAFVNCLILLTAGGLLLVYGGAFSQSGYQLSSIFCHESYGSTLDCTCPSGSTDCPVTVCINATLEASCGMESQAVKDDLNITNLPMDTCLVRNLGSEYYTCTTSSNFYSNFQLPGAVSLYLPTLNETELQDVAAAYSTAESLDRVSLQAWAETDVVLFGCIMLLLCLFQLLLLITNRLIIKWNHDNDFPHGKDPYFLMLHTSVHRADMKVKMLALRAFKAAGTGKLGFKSMKIHPAAVGKHKRFEVKVKMEAEAFGEGIWSLGMSFQETMVGGRRKVAIQGFRTGEDDDGNAVQSPGLTTGLQVGDVIVQVDGIDLVGGMKEFKHEVDEDKFLKVIKLTVERTIVKGNATLLAKAKKAKKAKAKYGMYPEVTKLVIQRKPGAPLGLNLSEIYGSGNEGYAQKPYLAVNALKENSPAYVAGIQVNDTILAIDGEMVFGLDELTAAVKGRNKIAVVVNRMMSNSAKGSFRESNVVDMKVQLDPTGIGGIGLGARVVEVASGIGEDSSTTFLMISGINSYPNGGPGPAARAGVKLFDLILMVNRQPVNTLKQLVLALKSSDSPVLSVRRLTYEYGNKSIYLKDSRSLTTKVLQVHLPEGHGLGVSLNEAYRNGESDPFVVVTAVRENTAANIAGIKEQDVVLSVDGEPIFAIDDVRTQMKGKKKFEMEVQRFSLADEDTGGITAENFWDKADDLFDRIDKASAGAEDGALSVADMHAFFNARAGVAKRYLDEMDGYSNGKETQQDGRITREEWYDYFDYLAQADTGVAETSPEAYAALRDLGASR